MPPTALITGATGLLGRQVLRTFSESKDWEAVGTGFSRASPPHIVKLDLSDQAAVEKSLDDVKPNLIVHCAANRFPDSCAADPAGTRALNITATSHLARLARSRAITLIYLSTDYVFPGVKGEAPYEADATPRPTTFYGETKLDGEKAVIEAYTSANGGGGSEKDVNTGRGVILRVPVLYGDTEEGFGNKESAVNTLLDTVWKAAELPAGSEPSPLKMDDWSQRYPTNTEDVARVIQDIALLYTSSSPSGSSNNLSLPQILQFSAEERFTKYEICRLLAEILDVDIEGKLIGDRPPEEGAAEGGGGGAGAGAGAGAGNTSVQRPYDTHLSTKALKDFGVNVYAQDFRAWWRWRLRAFRK